MEDSYEEIRAMRKEHLFKPDLPLAVVTGTYRGSSVSLIRGRRRRREGGEIEY